MKRVDFKASKEISTQLFTMTIAVAIGLLGACGAIAFRFLIDLAHYAFFRTDSYTLEWINTFSVWERVLLPAVGGLLVGAIACYLAKEVRGSGISEVMEATAFHGGAIRYRVIFAKMAAAAITIGSGGSAGREGPIVQIGSSIGSTLGQLLNVSGRKLRTFTACGAAAGIAATFNAPIAGALFSIEVILGDFAVHQFSPIVISSVTATVISRAVLGDSPAFSIPAYQLGGPFEFLPYAVLGIAAGLTAVAFTRTMSAVKDLDERLPMPALLKPAFGGLVVGLIGLALPQVYGVGYETINEALWGRGGGAFLLLIIVAKILATSATLGFGGSGGVFAPALVIGTALGASMGGLWKHIFPGVTSDVGAYALLGMGAVVSGVTHAPISSILIVFEMTYDYRLLPPLMVACILSILLAGSLCRESMYTIRMAKKGIDIHRGKDVNLLKNRVVRDIYTREVTMVHADSSFEEMMSVIERRPNREVFVVNARTELLGMLAFINIRNLLVTHLASPAEIGATRVADIANTAISPLFLSDTLDLALQQFARINEDELPVVASPKDLRLLGALRVKDVIAAYTRALYRWDLTGGTHSLLTAVTRQRHLHLSDEICVVEIALPGGFLGKRLDTLNLRKRYHVNILLIHKPSPVDNISPQQPHFVLPPPEYKFIAGDKLLLLGTQDDIERLQRL
ncbi:MAG: chloride channel protein [bacterium]|nr:chloride channel protein [bacterium]